MGTVTTGARLEPAATARSRAAAFVELTKPGITRMVLVTAAAGFYLASPGFPDLWRLLHALVGIGLAAAGTNALNQYRERDEDRLMKRTASRPLPSGRLQPGEALLFSVAISVAGLLYLVVATDPVTVALVLLSLTSYVFLYTPVKRMSWVSTPVGAVPGALPILAGWTAAGGAIDAVGLSLFAILYAWQLPHFYALAWIYREDYRAGGFHMVSRDDADGTRTANHILFSALVLLPLSLIPFGLGLTGPLYLAGAALLGGALVVLGAAVRRRVSDAAARRVFLASVLYLPALLLLMAVARI
jgi:heme o synthase